MSPDTSAAAEIDPPQDEAASGFRTDGHSAPSRRTCSVQRTIDVLSDAWAFLILREAFFGVRTFEGFRSALSIPRATLSDRLGSLTADGIFVRERRSPTGKRLEYRLTPMGLDLAPSYMALMQFGDRWLSDGAPPPLTLFHATCGEITHPIVACSVCRAEIGARDVTYRNGPGAGREPSLPGRNARRASDATKLLAGRPSAVSRTLQVIGDQWSFMVMREAFFGVRRYDRMQRNLGIAPNILTDRLSRLVENGAFARLLYQTTPPRHEYVLTAMGRDLYGPFLAMLAWGDRWLADGKPPLILTHKRCGQDFTPVVLCDSCLEPLEPHSIRYWTNGDDGGLAAVEGEARPGL